MCEIYPGGKAPVMIHWSPVPPTEPGYYWMRVQKRYQTMDANYYEPSVVRIDNNGAIWEFTCDVPDKPGSYVYARFEWCGPLEPPA